MQCGTHDGWIEDIRSINRHVHGIMKLLEIFQIYGPPASNRRQTFESHISSIRNSALMLLSRRSCVPNWYALPPNLTFNTWNRYKHSSSTPYLHLYRSDRSTVLNNTHLRFNSLILTVRHQFVRFWFFKEQTLRWRTWWGKIRLSRFRTTEQSRKFYHLSTPRSSIKRCW